MKEKMLITMTWCMALLSCGGSGTKTGHKEEHPDSAGHALQTSPNDRQGPICWKGTLDAKTNILLHYQIEDDVIVGELTYLDTKEKKPIKIIGTIESYEDFREYRLLEFEENGNITGIITGLPTEEEFAGSWFSPKTRKELAMDLRRVDTLISAPDIGAKAETIAGDYHYQYGKQGPQGELKVSKVDANRIAFGINSLTGEPARNIATVEQDTVVLDGNGFVYKVPETDNCEFRVRFFGDFALVTYTDHSDCQYTFGHNATVEGVFYKKK